jgi:multisubunit Na+/H+ antiporter MnhE subunit
MHRVLFWLGWFAVLNLIWLWLISAFVVSETILGIVASALAATAATAVREQALISFRPRLRWLAAAVQLPYRSLIESALVLAALGRQLSGRGRMRGRFRTVEVALPDDPAEAAAKRALLIAGESFAPNAYVLGVDQYRGLMLVHELVPSRFAEEGEAGG